MIVGPDFVWLHFPKCGGVTTENALKTMLSSRPGIAFDEIDHVSGVWHDTIPQRLARDPSFRLDGRRVICGIRRLPQWLLSLSHFEIERGQRTPTRAMLLRGEVYSSGTICRADAVMESFANPAVDAWVRTERAAIDLAKAFKLPLADVERHMGRENTNKIPYVKDVDFWFSPDEISALYAANPLWAEIERRVYGTLAIPQRIMADYFTS